MRSQGSRSASRSAPGPLHGSSGWWRRTSRLSPVPCQAPVAQLAVVQGCSAPPLEALLHARQVARSGLLGPLGHCRAQPFSPAFSQPQRHKDNLSQSTVPVSEVPSPAKVPSQPPSLLDELCPSLCARSWFCLQLGRWQCGPLGTARCDARVLWPALGQGQGHDCVCHHLSAPTCWPCSFVSCLPLGAEKGKGVGLQLLLC